VNVSQAHVSLRGVSKVFPTIKPGEVLHALGPIDLDLRKGEFFAVVGPSGCGKSTLLELIAGLAPVTAGTVEFEGRRIEADIPDGIGVVFQEDACFPWLSVEANIAFGLRSTALAPEAKARRVRDVLVLGAALRRHAPARVHRPHPGDRACSTSRSGRSTSRPGCSWATRCSACGGRPAPPCS
jgi:ABC-type sugar transport system ATPase subunit